MRRPLSASGPNNPYRTGSSAGYRNDPKAKPAVLLDMTNDRTAYAVSAQTAGDSAQHMFKDLEPWTTGRFLNFMGHGDTADQERTHTA
ncbi:hypothetical protein, partial [Streptomyces decoyicus]|uniref:hypothetical protein n=1 Tax=Streptomyces decoyicus TaxID=249567 RepID=UPI0033B424B0